jgi:uncharacterized protein
VAGLLAAAILLVNLEIARRAAPEVSFATPTPDPTQQYRDAFRPYARLANFGIAGVVGLLTGISSSAAWREFLLWRNSRPFGVSAPEPFGQDVSFYVFSIPFQRAVLAFGFGVVITAALLSAIAHFVHGSIRPEANRVEVATVVKVHLSGLLGVVALLKAWAYNLDRYELVFSPRGTVTGASYTDVNAQRPALQLLFIIALVVAVLLFVNMFRFRGWLLPGAALGVWAFSSILLGAAVPAVVQRFTVTPNEPQRERPFIEHNINYTRNAFNLDRIDVRPFNAQEDLDPETVAANEGTIDNVRIWDPTVLIPTYQRLQAIRTYYDFGDVDIDRYMIDGRLTQVMLSAREVEPTRLAEESQTWSNLRLTYTHGYGVVASRANAVTGDGLPSLLKQDIPPRAPEQLQADVPGIYYGENVTGFIVANTGREEIHYPVGEGDEGGDVVTTHYDGEGGIVLSNIMRRLAFAIRFGDTDLLISQFIQPDSRLIMRRNIRERVETAAPFLQYDGDPYIVVADGRYFWIQDAYTTTDRFPYSQMVNLGAATGGNVTGTANYIRNSVKVVIDAYDGTMNFYVWEPDDALAATYPAAFPELFSAPAELPPTLENHLRYPEDFFKIQAQSYRAYHITDPGRLYEREDVWDIPNDPVRSTQAASVDLDPYYVVMKLPGEAREEFLLMLPFTPRGRPLLNGWMAARMDPPNYGEVIAFSFPRGRTIEGPENIAARIEQNEFISRQFTLWEGAGSNVVRGNMLVIPIGESLIYVQPIYLEAAEGARALPELRRVIVSVGDRIAFEGSFEASLNALMEGRGIEVDDALEDLDPVDEVVEPTPPPALDGDVAALLSQAIEHFQRADAAMRQGDLATYQQENEAGRRAVEQANQQAGG